MPKFDVQKIFSISKIFLSLTFFILVSFDLIDVDFNKLVASAALISVSIDSLFKEIFKERSSNEQKPTQSKGSK